MQDTCIQSLGQENPLEKEMTSYFSILVWKNPMDRGTWRATVHRASKSWTRLSNWAHTHTKGNSVEKHTLFWLMVLEQLDIHNAKKRKKERKRIPINMQKITWNRKHIPKYSIQYIHKCKSKNYDDSSIKA